MSEGLFTNTKKRQVTEDDYGLFSFAKVWGEIKENHDGVTIHARDAPSLLINFENTLKKEARYRVDAIKLPKNPQVTALGKVRDLEVGENGANSAYLEVDERIALSNLITLWESQELVKRISGDLPQDLSAAMVLIKQWADTPLEPAVSVPPSMMLQSY
jgi:hypothetical protein